MQLGRSKIFVSQPKSAGQQNRLHGSKSWLACALAKRFGPKQLRPRFFWPKYLPWLALVVSASFACSHKTTPATQSNESKSATPQNTASAPAPTPVQTRPVQTEMHNVMFHFSPAAAAHIYSLTGELIPTGNKSMPVFDDKTSFEIRVTSAKVSITPTALGEIMNQYVFAKDSAPLKDLSLWIKDGRLHVKGKLHSKGDLPFETVGTLSPTSDGRIRIHSEKVKALKIPVKGFMNVFGIDLADVLNTSKVAGVDVDKDDLILDVSETLPPPHIQGKVTAVRIENNQVVTIFGTGEAPPSAEKGNYMAFKGNQVRFGKLTMDDADVAVIDLDPADPLDWFQDRYKDQLVAGYSKITPAMGLRAYVKDFGKLSRSGKGAENTPAQ
jgi:hypothetical protein